MERTLENLVFTPEQILRHAEHIQEVYKENPSAAKRYLIELLENSGLKKLEHPAIEKTAEIIEKISAESGETPLVHEISPIQKSISEEDLTETQKALEQASKEISFRKELEEFYLPKQLIEAIFDLGEIPKSSQETNIGIGFIDIADYTYLSKFLSPLENQTVLNGLYTAFNYVLQRHGGYLNKIEGDSLMFHFGGLLDMNIRDMDEKDALQYIARELFYTCVEMQRVCTLFNQANDKFLYGDVDKATKETLQKAFDIISVLRNTLELQSSMNALFQIRIRIGANVGKVTIGSFGPEGAKQWDVIGVPVIDAKRMESTAPIGGLRISEAFFDVLRDTGIAESYYERFRREASALFGYYKKIEKEELYKLSRVVLKDKKNAEFVTYSIQVNPALPEDLAKQTELLLEKGEAGAAKIIEFLQYYRGNKYVIQAIEDVFVKKGINIRKDLLLKTIYPKKYKAFCEKLKNDKKAVFEYVKKKYSLYSILVKLGEYQDKIKNDFAFQYFQLEDTPIDYINYNSYISKIHERVKEEYRIRERSAMLKLYFYNMVFPMVFKYIETSILEYQKKAGDLEEL